MFGTITTKTKGEIITDRSYVIKDKEGNFIAPKQTENGWHYLTYSGRTTGFTFYNEKGLLTAKQELKALNDLGNNFHLESVKDINSISKGKLITGKDTYKKVKDI